MAIKHPKKKTLPEQDARMENPVFLGPGPGLVDPFIGKHIGNCLIQKKMAEGGSAYIYKAFNVNFELPRIVKILKPSLVYAEETYLGFKQEAQFTARLDHTNIRRVFDTGEFDGHFFIEMDYIEGDSLREIMGKRNRIPEGAALNIALQIVKALHYAHNIKITSPDGTSFVGILHRDIKPENILVNSENHVYVMDFGAAQPLSLSPENPEGLVVGTFHYMSPEQISGKNLDARSDFFSLGIVLYELLAGHKPFAGENLPELFDRIKKGRYTPLKKRRRSLSPLTVEFITSLLNRKPEHRPSSTQDLLRDLQVCIQAYDSWGRGQKVKVPFSWKKFYPTLALFFSLCALGLSLYTWREVQTQNTASPAADRYMDSSFLLDEGRRLEEKEMWRAAITRYESVPEPTLGGRPDEYLEASIRSAHLYFTHFNQFTKARSILETLRQTYGDPAIDAYLGQIYFRLALYDEAIERLEKALAASRGSVIPQDIITRESYYYLANALDGRFTYIQQSEGELSQTLQAWKTYLEKNSCGEKSTDKSCRHAQNRMVELSKR